MLDRNSISSAITMFSKVVDERKHTPTLKKALLCEIQNGDPETGSRNNFGCIIDRNAIPNANTMFSRGADTMTHRPTSNANGFYVKFNMAAPKLEVVITLVVL